jgi:serine/threonine protein kinase/formylglycine-generating enzyme required for sulfatase activity
MLDKGDIVGDYTLVRFLGRGQFGEVWLAEKQLKFSNRKVQHALKFLSAMMDEVNVKSAGNEVDTWIEASGHPNVISVLDMLTYKERIVIASEYAEGGSLMDWLTKSGGRAPSHEKALEMMTGILSGIEHLHSRSVVHRDLKPDNILLMGGFPRITDFGISRIVSARSLSTVAMGSPFYMSPESFDGNKSTSTDIWSAGVILYEMLSGEHPYRSDTMYGLVSSIKNDLPRPLPKHIAPELRLIVDTALQKNLKERYSTAEDMRLVIEKEIYAIKARYNIPTEVMDVPVDPGAVTLVGSQFDLMGKDSVETVDQPMRFEDPAQAPSSSGDPGMQPIPPTAADTAVLPNPPAPPPRVEASLPIPVSESYLVEHPGRDIYYSQAVDPNPPPGSVDAAATRSGRTTTLLDSPAIQSDSMPAGAISGGAGTGDGFQDSQAVRSTGPMLIFAGVGGVMAIALIIGIIAFYFAASEMYSRYSGGPVANSANTTNTSRLPATPIPPEGMAYIPGGEFTMGRDNGPLPEERPAHKEVIEPFFMDIYEVTNEQYAKFVTTMNHAPPQGWNNGTFKAGEARFPVVGVSWEDASAYAAWVGKRLPTEQEWEFAARGTDGRVFPWGSQWLAGNANVGSGHFVAVGTSKGTSPFGLYDMVGNAGEWTSSDFTAYVNGRLSNRYDGKRDLKARRGADYDVTQEFATTTFRFGLEASGGHYDLTGFRCAQGIAK